MATVCYSEFEWPDKSSSKAAIRNQLLEAILQHAPNLLEELKDGPYKSYCELRLNPKFSHKNALRSGTHTHDFHNSVDIWLQRWNVNAPWFRFVVYETLEAWYKFYPEDPPTLFFQPVGFDERSLSFTVPAPPAYSVGIADRQYKPHITTRQQYIQRINRQCLETIQSDPLLKHAEPSHRASFIASIVQWFEKYCSEVERLYESRSWRRCKFEKRNLELHLEWTVKFQVCGKSLDEVVSLTSDADKSTVLRAVESLLEMIELPKRTDAKRGRRSGSKNKSKIPRQLGR